MTLKEAAAQIVNALWYDADWVGSPEQDNDGWWFDIELDGTPYTVSVKETP